MEIIKKTGEAMEAAKKERFKKILISFLIAVFITVIVVIPL